MNKAEKSRRKLFTKLKKQGAVTVEGLLFTTARIYKTRYDYEWERAHKVLLVWHDITTKPFVTNGDNPWRRRHWEEGSET